MHMEHDEVVWICTRYTFLVVDVELGLRYLGLILEPNDYYKKDSYFLIRKVEKRLHLWCNKWLSIGDRMILVKAILA